MAGGTFLLLMLKKMIMAIKLSKHHFWEWFIQNNKEYLQLHNKTQKELKYWKNEMSAHLRAYFKFLYFSISVGEEGTAGVLTISVSGKARYFKYVDNIVAIAPAIPGWTIQALEAPRSIDAFWEDEFGHNRIDPHELWCAVPGEEHLPGIAVYHMMYTEAENWLYTQAVEMALYNVLGERSFGLDIGPITVGNLSGAPQDAELIRLEELPAYMPRDKSAFEVDATGKIWER